LISGSSFYAQRVHTLTKVFACLANLGSKKIFIYLHVDTKAMGKLFLIEVGRWIVTATVLEMSESDCKLGTKYIDLSLIASARLLRLLFCAFDRLSIGYDPWAHVA
jgi:hypothetical protein